MLVKVPYQRIQFMLSIILWEKSIVGKLRKGIDIGSKERRRLVLIQPARLVIILFVEVGVAYLENQLPLWEITPKTFPLTISETKAQFLEEDLIESLSNTHSPWSVKRVISAF